MIRILTNKIAFGKQTTTKPVLTLGSDWCKEATKYVKEKTNNCIALIGTYSIEEYEDEKLVNTYLPKNFSNPTEIFI